MKKIAVVGAFGRLGQSLVTSYQSSFEIVSIGRSVMDLASPETFEESLSDVQFDLLILCAAMTAVDDCERRPADAYLINATAAGELARICSAKGCRMIAIGTDYVFDGSQPGMLTESAPTRPISVYGASKLKGEELVLAASPANLVVRVSWLFGPGSPAFPEWIINRACGSETLVLPEDKISCPTLTTDFCELLEPILFDSDVNGILHLCNSEPCTWREWGQFCVDVAAEAALPVIHRTVEKNRLQDIAAFVARRPPNSAMSTDRYIGITGVVPRHWREATKEYLLGSELFRKLRRS